MESKVTSNKEEEEKEQSKLFVSNNKLKKIKSNFILKIFFGYINKRKSLEMIKYNKKIQKRINIDSNHYKSFSEKYSSIEIEIIPMKNKYCPFVNIIEEEDQEYYHIYFNDNKDEEIKRTYLNENDKVSKINIIIDYQVTSLYCLFNSCKCIESINFKKFNRNNITDMSYMFFDCLSLKQLNLNNFNTNNVTNMYCMFFGCSSLEELNLDTFNTNNVVDMNYMFARCSSLKELNINNFNTNNVTDMSGMFSDCSSLIELNIGNFNTKNVIDMSNMFSGCSDKLKLKIKTKFKNFSKRAFKN